MSFLRFQEARERSARRALERSGGHWLDLLRDRQQLEKEQAELQDMLDAADNGAWLHTINALFIDKAEETEPVRVVDVQRKYGHWKPSVRALLGLSPAAVGRRLVRGAVIFYDAGNPKLNVRASRWAGEDIYGDALWMKRAGIIDELEIRQVDLEFRENALERKFAEWTEARRIKALDKLISAAGTENQASSTTGPQGMVTGDNVAPLTTTTGGQGHQSGSRVASAAALMSPHEVARMAAAVGIGDPAVNGASPIPRRSGPPQKPWRLARLAWMKARQWCQRVETYAFVGVARCSAALESAGKPDRRFRRNRHDSPIRVARGENPWKDDGMLRESPSLATHSLFLTDVEVASALASSPECALGLSVCPGRGNYRDPVELVEWLLSRLIVTYGRDLHGRDDQLDLDRAIYRRGTLHPSRNLRSIISSNPRHASRRLGSGDVAVVQLGSVGEESMRPSSRGLIICANVVKGGGALSLVAYDPGGCSAQNIEFDLSAQQTPFRHTPCRQALREMSGLFFHGTPVLHRHTDLPTFAGKLANQLLVLMFNGAPRVSHTGATWATTQVGVAALRSLKKQRKHTAASERLALSRALQFECRQLRLDEYWAVVAQARRRADASALRSAVAEWAGLSAEDAESHRCRAYLVSDQYKIDEISEAFATFDRDSSGTISADEFQNICFEIGEILTEEQVAQAVAEIDLDGSGTITFTEFAIWWLCAEREADTVAGARLRMLQAKLRMRKRIRKMAVSTKMATHALALSALAGASTARRRVVTAANTVRSSGRTLGNIASAAVQARRDAFKSATVRRTPTSRALTALASPAALFRSKLRARRAKKRLAGKLKQRALEAEAERLEQGKRNLAARLAEQERLKKANEAKEKAELEQFRMAAIKKAREQAAAKAAKEKALQEDQRLEEEQKAAKKAAYLEKIANERALAEKAVRFSRINLFLFLLFLLFVLFSHFVLPVYPSRILI